MNPVPQFLALVAKVKGMSVESAALNVACRSPQLADAVLDFIGSHPVAEPELRVLQERWRSNRR